MKKTFITIGLFVILKITVYASGSPMAVITIQKGELTNTIPFSLNLDGSNSTSPNKEKLEYKWIYPDNKIINSKNPRSYRFEKAGDYEILLTVTTNSSMSDTASVKISALTKTGKISNKTKQNNGDLSNKIQFSEILPNPEGIDTNNEWIELFNTDIKNINLGNWKIANSTKNFTLPFPTIIEANDYLIIEKPTLKISLKNTNGKLELIDFNNKTIDSVEYKKAIEGESYSKISKTKWIWAEPSKNKTNAEYETIEGEIINGVSNQKFTIKSNSGETIDIFLEKEANMQLYKTLLKTGVMGRFSIEKTTKKLESLELNNSINEKKTNSNNLTKILLTALGSLLTSALWLSWRCKSFQKHPPLLIPIRH